MLLHCKSSPLIDDAPKNQRPSNTSKRSSRQRDSNEYQYRKVANPLLSLGQENIVPPGLLREVGDLEYITPHHLQKIQWGQVVGVPRRSSVFAKHLQAMQRAAKQQQQRSRTMLGPKKKQTVCFEEMQDEKSISIEEQIEQQSNDGVSLRMKHWPQIERMNIEEEQMFILEQSHQPKIFYYSQNQIQEGFQDLDDYFYP